MLPGFRHAALELSTYWTALVATLLLVPCASWIAAAEGPPDVPRVRATDARLAELLEAGIARSQTLRELVDTLRRSDVIVYITLQTPARSVVYGELHFLASGAGVRYLRIAVQQDLSRSQVTAMMAHELQHAAEVAAAPEVVDGESMAALYDSIGYRLGSSRETADALLAADRVLHELTAFAAVNPVPAGKH